MNQDFKKGLLWFFGAFVGFLILTIFIGIIVWILEQYKPKSRDWELADQSDLTIKSYATRILEHHAEKSELIISGELEGKLSKAIPKYENDLAIAAIVRGHNGVVLTDCEDYIDYSKYYLSGTKSFLLSCIPPGNLQDIGTVDFVLKHAWRALPP